MQNRSPCFKAINVDIVLLLCSELVRLKHIDWIKRSIKFLLGHQALLEHDVVNRTVGLVSLLGHLCAGLVADDGVEGGNDADGVLDHLLAMFLVDGDAKDTLLGEGVDGIGHPGDALEDALGDDGLHHVEFELSVLGCNGYGSIVADHLEAGLVDYLGDDRINLARHN